MHRDTNSLKLNPKHYNYEANYESTTTIYTNDESIDKFVTSATILLGLAMLIAPLWLLQHIYTAASSNLTARLGIITGFLVLFVVLLSVVTVARPFEVIAGAAAYAAVLMVFMQLGIPGN